MEESLFHTYLEGRFQPVVVNVTELINGETQTIEYFHKQMLTEAFSPTMRWNALSSSTHIIAADVVALDTSLPLKKRESIKKVEGDIPKIGMKMQLTERAMLDLQLLEQLQGMEKELYKKLFEDVPKVIMGIDEQLEYMHLSMLSSGYSLVADVDNPGIGIRVDYSHPDSRKYGAKHGSWKDADAKPMSDIEHILSEAKTHGNRPRFMMMDKTVWDKFKVNEQVRKYHGAYINFTGNSDSLPVLTLEQTNDMLASNYNGLNIVVVDRPIAFESNGKVTYINPWADGAVTFTNSMQVGTLTYGRLVEESRPVNGVDYAKSGSFTLVSKYAKNDPVSEFTSSQAMVLPVLGDVYSIYIVDVYESSDDVQTESDANYDYEGTAYTLASVISAINDIKGEDTVSTDNTDAEIQIVINGLSDEEITTFEANITAA